MKPGNFLLKNELSEAYGIVIQDRPQIDTPKRKIAFRSSFGQSGDNPYDEEAYSNTTMELNMYATGTPSIDASMRRDMIYDLFDSGTYMDFIPYFDESKIYRVMTLEPPNFTTKYFMDEGQQFDITLTVKPYKLLVLSPTKILTASGSTIVNTSSKTSLPRIKIFGSGDVTLTVNGIPFVIKNITTDIILDSELMIAYRETSIIDNENDKIFTREYPFLKKGSNTISWTGTVSKVEIEPRWRTLA